GGEGGAGAAEEGGEDGEEDDDFAWGAPKHIFVLSSAGKPVFSLSGDEQHLATLTGLIQGLLSLCEDCDGDEMESISAGSRKFVFLKRGDLVLVAVSSPSASGAKLVDDGGGGGREGGGEEGEGEETEAPECESFLRLQLEYMYASILFLLTSKVQEILRRSPGYDLRGLLGGADTSLRGAIDLSEPCRGRGRMLAGGVETVWMDPSIRTKVSRDLQTAQAAAAPSALYALWLCGEKLVSLAQPKEPSHRLDSRDLLLLVNFVATQPALRNAESWTPVCFPRFQEKGHLYAYIAFLEEPTAPTLPATTSATTTTNGKPASGRGGGGAEDSAGEEGGGGASTRTKSGRGEDYRLAGESCVILVSVEASSEQFQAFRRARIALETRFRSALGTNWDRYLGMGGETEREGILTKFCTQMQALHFYYCLRGRRGGAPCVTQCLSSPFVGPLADDADAQRVVWGCYTRAALRLRRGSCQEGRVFCGTGRGEWCLDEQRSSDAAGGGGAGGGGGRGGEGVRGEGGGGDQATALFESDPVHSLTYEIGPKVTVMSLFGRRSDGSGGGRWTSSSSSGRGDRDELHACFPSSVPPEVAYKAAVRLVAIVRRDRDWLFLTGTGAPK
ncbi:unnamed protein product, partial [Laminaria digitata]